MLFDGRPYLAVLKGLAVGTASDNFVPLPNATRGVIFRAVTFTNASANCSTSTATIGVNQKAAAAGTAIVTAATGTHTGLTTSTKFTDGTIALSGDYFVPNVADAPTTVNGAANNTGGVYIRVAGTPNVTATVDVYIFGDVLT